MNNALLLCREWENTPFPAAVEVEIVIREELECRSRDQWQKQKMFQSSKWIPRWNLNGTLPKAPFSLVLLLLGTNVIRKEWNNEPYDWNTGHPG